MFVMIRYTINVYDLKAISLIQKVIPKIPDLIYLVEIGNKEIFKLR